jgi:hypothetical protein
MQGYSDDWPMRLSRRRKAARMRSRLAMSCPFAGMTRIRFKGFPRCPYCVSGRGGFLSSLPELPSELVPNVGPRAGVSTRVGGAIPCGCCCALSPPCARGHINERRDSTAVARMERSEIREQWCKVARSPPHFADAPCGLQTVRSVTVPSPASGISRRADRDRSRTCWHRNRTCASPGGSAPWSRG